MQSLLLEIGTEEIPAGYIQPGLDALAKNVSRKLTEARIDYGAVSTFGTPRRMVIFIEDVAERQRPVTETVMGPPEKVAVDDKGQFTLAATKFAEKAGVTLKQLTFVENKKGRYLSAAVSDKGTTTQKYLQQTLPEIILAIPFPKTMRWSDLKIAFARPIQSILALLGKSIISFTLADRLKSGRYAWGHMFMCHKRIKIDTADTYIETMRNADVVVDFQERRRMVQTQIESAAADMGGKVIEDDALLDIVTNLVEIPIASAGRFSETFLELPHEVLITSMREHQKYFAVEDSQGRLLPCFIAVNNTRANDMKLVARGHERVLRARLSDAQFFYHSDLKQRMDDWTQRLKGVLFQAQLGSMYDKVQRVEKVASQFAKIAAPDLNAHVARAAQLCKSDLVSQVVYEFPNLQGIMGRVYATVAGEDSDVATAIEEHYRPTFSGGELPKTLGGSLLAIADKLDTICGCFSVGLIPTGASDPYALRRQGIGIVQIMLAHQIQLSLSDAIDACLALFAPEDVNDTRTAVYTFIQQRMSHMLADENFDKDVIAAVVSVSVDNIPNVWQRVKALQQLKGHPDFEPLAVAFKRAVNIIRKSEENLSEQPETTLFEDASEQALYNAYLDVNTQVQTLLAQGDIDAALRIIAQLREPVDLFFESVMVMIDDPAIRRNRLALLQTIASLFNSIADFSKIAT